MHLQCADTSSNFQRDDPSRGLNWRHICTRNSARHKVERATEWFIPAGTPWPPFSGRGRIRTPGHSNCYLIIDDYKSFDGCRLRRRLRVRNNKLHSQREICSAGHEPKLLWSLSLWNRNALFAVARVCSRILLLDSCVRRPCRSCILQGENQRFGSQNTVRGKSLG